MSRHGGTRGGGGGYGQVQQVVEKRKLSIAMRDYDNSSLHCNGINSLAIAGNANGQTNLFTASRDRLIKIWQVDYA